MTLHALLEGKSEQQLLQLFALGSEHGSVDSRHNTLRAQMLMLIKGFV